MKQKWIILTGIVVASLVCIVLVYSYFNAQHPHFEYKDKPSEAVFPIVDDGVVLLDDSTRFRIDTGALVSKITPADIERLKNRGVEVDSVIFPSLAKTLSGEAYFAKKRYSIKIPVFEYVLVEEDSNHCRYKRKDEVVNYLDDVIFLPSDPKDTVSTIGVDILERFVVEYQRSNNAIILRNYVPVGYQEVAKIESPFTWYNFIGCGDKYYLPINIQNVSNLFYLDTGFQDIDLKLPEADTARVNSTIKPGIFKTTRGEVNALYTGRVWVKLGNRQGSHRAMYVDYGDENYAINPLNYFDQDIVLDFVGKALYQRVGTTH